MINEIYRGVIGNLNIIYLDNNINREFKVTIGKFKEKDIFFYAWIDTKFNVNGELYLFLGQDDHWDNLIFTGVIDLSNNNTIKFYNFGFFLNNEDIILNFNNKRNLINKICEEVQKWSEKLYD